MPTSVSTDSAKRALFEHLIDDASLFPPSGLPMARALRAHARHRESAYAWVGGNFVVPASRLAELLAARDPSMQFVLSVILDAAQNAKGDTIRADFDRVTRGAADGVVVSGFEFRAPVALPDALERLLTAVSAFAGDAPVSVWCEAPYQGGWSQPPDATLARLAALRQNVSSNVQLGAKLRCGGMMPGATPSIDDIAAFLIAAHAHDVPWKATAGLHHPVRSVHDGTSMHGFLNLFVAGVGLHAGVLNAARVVGVLAEENPRAFVVDPAHIGWDDVRIEAEAVAAARARCVAFGSCSFDEPVDDLRELGMLL